MVTQTAERVGVAVRGSALTLCLLVATAANAQTRPDPAVPPDPRLGRVIQLSEYGSSLKAALQAMSLASGLSHRTIPSFETRSVVMLNGRLPVRGFQEAFARNWQLTWRRAGGEPAVYWLVETKKDQEVRAAAHSAARRKGIEWMRARWAEVERMMGLPKDRLEKLAAGGDAQAGALLHPPSNAHWRLAFGLPGAVSREFWNNGRVSVPVSTLDPRLQNLARQTRGNTSIRVTLSDGRVLDDTSDPARDGTLTLSTGGRVDRPTVWASLRHGYGGKDSNLLDSVGLLREPPERRRLRDRSSPSRPPEDNRFREKVTLKEPASRRRLEAGERPPGAKPMAVLLRELAAQVDIPVVAECEYREKDDAWLRRQWWLADDIVKKPVHEALDLLCSDFEYEWKFRDGVLLLRPRLWFLPSDQREYVYPKVPAAPRPAP